MNPDRKMDWVNGFPGAIGAFFGAGFIGNNWSLGVALALFMLLLVLGIRRFMRVLECTK